MVKTVPCSDWGWNTLTLERKRVGGGGAGAQSGFRRVTCDVPVEGHGT